MKLQVAAAACSICSVVAMSSGLSAEELRLSERQLDTVTAGATSLLASRPDGASPVSILNPPAPTPPSPPSEPTPTVPNPNQFVLIDGGTQLSITLPVTSGGSTQISAVFDVSPGRSVVGGATQFTSDGGGDAVIGGISAITVSSQSN